jgi:L-lactate dehydrogenase complex protein LldG
VTTDRDRFLQRVRAAVAAGNRAGAAPALEPRGKVGYQGAGPHPVARFRDELAAAGGQAHIVPDRAAAVATVLQLVEAKSARRVLLGGGAVIDPLNLGEVLRSRGVEVCDPASGRDAYFAADMGITGVDYLIAETGSLALFTRPDQPRSFSLLPPVHVAVADRSQILPDLFDLFAVDRGLPSACLSLITGPSKTGDIELRLVTGVHGPGEVVVVLVDPPHE